MKKQILTSELEFNKEIISVLLDLVGMGALANPTDVTINTTTAGTTRPGAL